MRSEGLFKKIGAAFTAVAVLSSVGITTFAAGEVTGSVAVAETAEGSGIYNVAIDYTNSASSTVGVTMLAFADTENDGKFEDSDIPAGYQDTGMQIVGFDQSSETGGGTFNFLVDTNETSDTDAIRMSEGDVGIVLLSADGAEAPTGYLFAIPKDADPTFNVDDIKIFMGGAEVTEPVVVPYGTTVDYINAALESVTVEVSGTDGDGNPATETWNVNWVIDPAYSETTPSTYTVTGTLSKPEGANGILPEGKETIEAYITVDELSWTAEAGTIADIAVEVEKNSDTEDITKAVKAKLVETAAVITVVDGDDETNYSGTVAMTEEIADYAAYVSNDGDTYTYTVTVPYGEAVNNVNPEGSNASVPDGGIVVGLTVSVTYKATNDFVGEIKAYMGTVDNIITTAVSLPADTEADKISDALVAKNIGAIVTGTSDIGPESEQWIIESWDVTNVDDPATDKVEYSATAVFKQESIDGSLATNKDDLSVTIDVVVEAAAAPPASEYKRGDVDLNGTQAAPLDLTILKAIVLGTMEAPSAYTSDIDGNGTPGAPLDLTLLKGAVLGTYTIVD